MKRIVGPKPRIKFCQPLRSTVERLRVSTTTPLLLEQPRQRVLSAKGGDLRPERSVGFDPRTAVFLLREGSLDRRSLRGDLLT